MIPKNDPRKQEIINKLTSMADVREKDITIEDKADGKWQAKVDARDIECTIFPRPDGSYNLSVTRYGF